MKIKTINSFLLFGLICIYCVSCQSTNKKKDTNNDILPVAQKILDITCDSGVLYIRPTVEQIEQMKSNYSNEEDFYVMADDANFYSVNAIEYLQNKNVDIFYLDSIKTVCFNRKDTLDFSNLAWDFVLYKKNEEYKIVNAIDLKYEFEKYFDTAESLLQPDDLEDWDSPIESIGVISDDIGDLSMTTWSNNCDSNYSVYFDVTGAQFHFSTNYTMNALLKKRSTTSYAVYFSYPIVRPIPENMEDCKDYAENIPIAKIEEIGNELKFTWFGFYDTKKETRVHTQNPFNENAQSLFLKKCTN
jgi:hypothetical protein